MWPVGIPTLRCQPAAHPSLGDVIAMDWSIGPQSLALGATRSQGTTRQAVPSQRTIVLSVLQRRGLNESPMTLPPTAQPSAADTIATELSWSMVGLETARQPGVAATSGRYTPLPALGPVGVALGVDVGAAAGVLDGVGPSVPVCVGVALGAIAVGVGVSALSIPGMA
jgi:hypothetical protein